ncbi:cytochrome P450 [Streptomyces sp. NPDC014986]|uniref:cytochrome P450 family protein n=1 Tax=Streptomyces sp. NPDC014986 TaxID=3364934 RepID=UPI0036FF00CD
MTALNLMDPEVLRDPFGTYARIRTRAPLVRAAYPWGAVQWLATRYSDVKAVLTDPRLVNNPANVPEMNLPHAYEQALGDDGIPDAYVRYLVGSILSQDGPGHLRLRRLSSRAFTVRRVNDLRPRVTELAHRLLAALPGRARDGVVDLLEDFSYPLSIDVICEIVGIPEEAREQWHTWGSAFYTMDPAVIGPAVRGMVDHLHLVIEERRATPAGDLLTGLVQAEDEQGEPLTDEEIATLVLTFVTAGNETTAHLIGNGVAALLTHSDQLALLRSDRRLLSPAVDELMRWCTPVQVTQPRYATEDLEVGGVAVRKGEQVVAVIGAAGHDPDRFPDPERFDITRGHRAPHEAHVGFGFGPHYCLGAALAHQETAVALDTLFDRFPGLALAVPPSALERQPFPGAWRLKSLPVRL